MTKQNSMLTGKPIKSIIKFSLPIMASSLLQYNYITIHWSTIYLSGDM